MGVYRHVEVARLVAVSQLPLRQRVVVLAGAAGVVRECLCGVPLYAALREHLLDRQGHVRELVDLPQLVARLRGPLLRGLREPHERLRHVLPHDALQLARVLLVRVVHAREPVQVRHAQLVHARSALLSALCVVLKRPLQALVVRQRSIASPAELVAHSRPVARLRVAQRCGLAVELQRLLVVARHNGLVLDVQVRLVRVQRPHQVDRRRVPRRDQLLQHLERVLKDHLLVLLRLLGLQRPLQALSIDVVVRDEVRLEHILQQRLAPLQLHRRREVPLVSNHRTVHLVELHGLPREHRQISLALAAAAAPRRGRR